MHWLTWLGLVVIAIGSALTILGQHISNNKSNTEITSLSEKNIELSTEINKINKEIAATITGGESFCFLFPTTSFTEINTIDFNLNHYGKYPVYDLAIKIWDDNRSKQKNYDEITKKYLGYKTKQVSHEEWQRLKEDKNYIINNIKIQNEIKKVMQERLIFNEHLGTIPPIKTSNIMDPSIFKCTIPSGIDENNYLQKYDVNIHARNGVYKQKIEISVRNKRYHIYSVVEKIISDTEREVVREYESIDSEGFAIKLLK